MDSVGKFNPGAVPIWRTSSFAGEFGDSHIENTNLQGGLTGIAIDTILQRVIPIPWSNEQERNTLLNTFTADDFHKLEGIFADLGKAAEIEKLVEASFRRRLNSLQSKVGLEKEGESRSPTEVLVQRLTDEVEEMAPGGRLFLCGGFSCINEEGHAIMYVIERSEDPKFYSFTVCNTGCGNNYHETNDVLAYPKTMVKTALHLGEIEAYRLASPDTLFMLMYPMIYPSDKNDEKSIYELLLPHLLGPTRRLDIEVIRWAEQSGNFETPQRSGTCFYKCILSTIKYSMKRIGFSLQQQKQFSLWLRLAFLSAVERDLEDPLRTDGFNESDRFIIDLGCNNAGKAIVKMFNKYPSVIESQLANLEEKLDVIRKKTAECLARCLGSDNTLSDSHEVFALPPERPFSTKIPYFNRFELLLGDMDNGWLSCREDFKGSPIDGTLDLFVDLSFPATLNTFPRASRLSEFPMILSWCCDKCNALRSKIENASPTSTLLQICSLIQFVFLRALPLPKPDSCWTDTELVRITASEQRSCLESISVIAYHYASASGSLSYSSPSLRTSRILTIASAFVFFDAVVRLEAEDGPSPLSVVLKNYPKIATTSLRANPPVSLSDIALQVHNPETAEALSALLHYFEKVIPGRGERGSRPDQLFEIEFTNDTRYFQLSHTTATFAFVNDLKAVYNIPALKQPSDWRGFGGYSREGAWTYNSYSDTEKFSTWITSSFDDINPVVASYRNLTLIYRYILDPSVGSSGESRILLLADVKPKFENLQSHKGSRGQFVFYRIDMFGKKLDLDNSRFSEKAPFGINDIIGSCKSEDDIMHKTMFPNEVSNILSAQETEQFASFLLYRHIAHPLVLQFFQGDRVNLLVDTVIQSIVEQLFFEPGKLLHFGEQTNIVRVPAENREQLRSSLGILMEEAQFCPDAILVPLKGLVLATISRCVSCSYNSGFSNMLLFILRIILKFESMVLYSCGSIIPSSLSELHTLIVDEVLEDRFLSEWVKIALEKKDMCRAVLLYSHIAHIYSISLEIMKDRDAQNDQFKVDAVPSDALSSSPFFKAFKGFHMAAIFVVSWNSSVPSAAGDEIRDEKGKADALVYDDAVSTVFSAIQSHRSASLRFLPTLGQDLINDLLDSMATIALQHPFKDCAGWCQSAKEELLCELTVETAHPYPASSDWSQTVLFPGARSINIHFDGQCATEEQEDIVTISYPGSTLTISGGTGKQWPGANGCPPISIPGDTFVVSFHSDASVGDWGFRFTARADINLECAQELYEDCKNSGLENVGIFACKLAVRDANNFYEDARQMIFTDTQKYVIAEKDFAERKDRKISSGHSNGRYEDSVGYMTINFHTSELFIQNKIFIPVPLDISVNEDFKRVFGEVQIPFCTIQGRYAHRKDIKIICPHATHGVYNIQAWTPLQSSNISGTGRGAMLGDTSIEDGGSTAINLPSDNQPEFLFCSRNYVEYIKSSCGWFSDLFVDYFLQKYCEDLEIKVWCSQDSKGTIEESTVDGHILIKVKAVSSEDLVLTDGDPGAWFYIFGSYAKERVYIYKLEEIGRKMQYHLVAVSDSRYSFTTFELNDDESKEPPKNHLRYFGGFFLGSYLNDECKLVSRPGVGLRKSEKVGSLLITRSRVAVADNESGIFSALERTVDLKVEEGLIEEFISPTSLVGIIPEVLIEEYQFWRTGARTLRGYKYQDLSDGKGKKIHPESLLVITDRNERGLSIATIHRLVQGVRSCTLINPDECSSTIFDGVLPLVVRVETLSHILFWSESPFGAEIGLNSIELPRLKATFCLRQSSSANAEYSLMGHDDLFLTSCLPSHVKTLLEDVGCAELGLPLKNAHDEFFLFLPNYGLVHRKVLNCPFFPDMLPEKNAKWSRSMQTHYFIYPVHPSEAFIEFPSHSAALYCMMISFMKHKYSMVSRLLHSVCVSDLHLNSEHKFILSYIKNTAPNNNNALSYCQPDAHACRLSIALMCETCGENMQNFTEKYWDIRKDYQGYIKKYPSVSQACRLTEEDELSILRIIGEDYKSKKTILEQTQNEKTLTVRLPYPNSLPQQFTCPFFDAEAKDVNKLLESLGGSSKPAGGLDFFMSMMGLGDGNDGSRDNVIYFRPGDEDIGEDSKCPETGTPTSPVVSIRYLNDFFRLIEDERDNIMNSRSGFALLYEMLIGNVVLNVAKGRVNHHEWKSVPDDISAGNSSELFTPEEFSAADAFLVLCGSMGIEFMMDREEAALFMKEYDGNFDEAMCRILDDSETEKDKARKLLDAMKLQFEATKNQKPRKIISWQLAKLLLHRALLQKQEYHEESCVVLLKLLIIAIETDIAEKRNDFPRASKFPDFPYALLRKRFRSEHGCPQKDLQMFYMTARKVAPQIAFDKILRPQEPLIFWNGQFRPQEKGYGYISYCSQQEQVRIEISDTSCCTRFMCPGETLSSEDVRAFATYPLYCVFESILGLNKVSVSTATMGTSAISELPFDIRNHQSLRDNPAALAMIRRISEDLKNSAAGDEIDPYQFQFVTNLDFLLGNDQNLISSFVLKLQILVQKLEEIKKEDMKTGIYCIKNVLDLINRDTRSPKDTSDVIKCRLHRKAGRRMTACWEFVVSTLISTRQLEDLQQINPFLREEDLEKINFTVIATLLRFVRSRQAVLVCDKANQLIAILQSRCNDFSNRSNDHVLLHKVEELAVELSKKRHFVSTETGEFDPRFLVFEYLSGFLLRFRQVQLVQQFMESRNSNKSCVHQMIMGAGKTQVISPLLALMMADGTSLISLVCPQPLMEQSRRHFRNRFSTVLPKKILTMNFDRSAPENNSPHDLKKLKLKLENARKKKSVIITTPQSIKSLFLKYIDLLSAVRAAPDLLYVPSSELSQFRHKNEVIKEIESLDEKSEMAAILAEILLLFSDRFKGVALLDEVDLLLHPMKSELNFPIGPEEPFPLLPMRFELPIHLLRVFLDDNDQVSSKITISDAKDRAVQDAIRHAIRDGKSQFAFQSIPHLTLLSEKYYFTFLAPSVGQWCVVWLKSQPSVVLDLKLCSHGAFPSDVLRSVATFVSSPSGSPECNLSQENLSSYGFSTLTIQLINLCREWVRVYLPFCLSKIHRVHYGLIGDSVVQLWREQELEAAGGDLELANEVVLSRARRLLAVPFVGKDTPSRSSEFANPEVLIGLTSLAYYYNGLRPRDVLDMLKLLKDRIQQETGPISKRPSRVMFENWKQMTAKIAAKASNVLLPLELLNTGDSEQVNNIHSAIGSLGSVVEHYMSEIVFPNVLKYRKSKIQANGVDLGGEMIFGSRFGFSGTPSDILPSCLQPCYYESGSEAEIIRVLLSPKNVLIPENFYNIGKDWTVDMLLRRVAIGGYHALIDTGALITGYSAEQVARLILDFQSGLEPSRRMEVCVFLNNKDIPMVVDRSGRPPFELDRCGVPLDKRFTFYDHIHTTGTDIRQYYSAIAVVTLGKDMTLRDYSQGSWRMRGIGKGQRIALLVIEEIKTLIKAVQSTENPLIDIVAWLLTNSCVSEKMQYTQLQVQSLADIWRRAAFNKLILNVKHISRGECLVSSFRQPLSKFEKNVILSDPGKFSKSSNDQVVSIFHDSSDSTVSISDSDMLDDSTNFDNHIDTNSTIKILEKNFFVSKFTADVQWTFRAARCRVDQLTKSEWRVGFISDQSYFSAFLKYSKGESEDFSNLLSAISTVSISDSDMVDENSVFTVSLLKTGNFLVTRRDHGNEEETVICNEVFDIHAQNPVVVRGGGSSTLHASTSISDVWTCKFCTFAENKAGTSICEMCDSPAGDTVTQNSSDSWSCSACTFLNPTGVSNCQVCNSPSVAVGSTTESTGVEVSASPNQILPYRLCFYGKNYDILFCEKDAIDRDKSMPSLLRSSIDIFDEDLFNGISGTFEKPKTHLEIMNQMITLNETRMSETELFQCREMLIKAQTEYTEHGKYNEEGGHDREIVKEQEKEKDEHRERIVTQVVHPSADREHTADYSWSLRQAFEGTLAHEESETGLYPLADFNIATQGPSAFLKLPYPEYLLATQSFSPFLSMTTKNRRLKNVNVILEYKPGVKSSLVAPTDGLEEDRAHRKFFIGDLVVLTNLVSKPELNGMEGRVVSFIPDKGRYEIETKTGKMSFKPENLRKNPTNVTIGTLVKIMGSPEHLHLDELTAVVEGWDENSKCLLCHVETVETHIPIKPENLYLINSDGSMNSKPVLESVTAASCGGEIMIRKTSPNSDGKYYIIVSLAEAETLFRVLQKQSVEYSDIFSLYLLDPQPQGSNLMTPSVSSSIKNTELDSRMKNLMEPGSLEVCLQCTRFFNNVFFFEEDSLVWLVRLFQGVSCDIRRHVFESSGKCRLRDQTKWDHMPVSRIFTHETVDQLENIRTRIIELSASLRIQYRTTVEAFKHFDKANYGVLNCEDIMRGGLSLQSPVSISPEEAAGLIAYCLTYQHDSISISGEQVLSLSEFSEAFDIPEGSNDILNFPDTEDLLTEAPSHAMDSSELQSETDSSVVRANIAIHKAKLLSHMTSPDLMSIGRYAVIQNNKDTHIKKQFGKLLSSNDGTLSTDAVGLISLAPRGIKLAGSNRYCFEITVVHPGNSPFYVGFGESDSDSAIFPRVRSRDVLSDRVHPQGHPFNGSLKVSNSKPGDIYRLHVNLKERTISYCVNRDDDAISHGELNEIYRMGDLNFDSGLFPFVSFQKPSVLKVNMGAFPFSSSLGPMREGYHSVQHYIRRKQEFEFVRYRNYLGSFGKLIKMSGGGFLEIKQVKDEDRDLHVWTMKDIQTESEGGHKFPTVYLDGVVLTSGRWYYEVEIGVISAATQFGFADLNFVANNKEGQGVGDDKHSWAFDGDRACLWHMEQFNSQHFYGRNWQEGSVLGCACDMNVGEKSISFSIDGLWLSDRPAFFGIDAVVGLTPALTCQVDRKSDYKVKFGPCFKYPPPEGSRPISEYIENAFRLLKKDETFDVASEEDAPVPFGLMRQVSAQPEILPLKDLRAIPLVVASGSDQVDIIDPDHQNPAYIRLLCSDDTSYPSVVADRVHAGQVFSDGKDKKFLYEVKLSNIPKNMRICLGFADDDWVGADWSAKKGVGDDERSCGVYLSNSGLRQISVDSKYAGQLHPLGCTIKSGSTVSIGIDIDLGKMIISIDGAEPLNVFEEEFCPPREFFLRLKPAISAGWSAMRTQLSEEFGFHINLGHLPLTIHSDLKDQGYRSFQSLLTFAQFRELKENIDFLSQRLGGEDYKNVLATILKVLENIRRVPGEPTFRILKKANSLVAGTLLANEEAVSILVSAGFEMKEKTLELNGVLNFDRIDGVISMVKEAIEL